jgi:hypothetical protein
MIDLHSLTEFKEYYPPLDFNKDNIVSVELKIATAPEIQAQGREEMGVGPEKAASMSYEFMKKYVGEIRGLKVDGKPVTTIDEVRESGLNSLYNWIFSAVTNDQVLRNCEIKN